MTTTETFQDAKPMTELADAELDRALELANPSGKVYEALLLERYERVAAAEDFYAEQAAERYFEDRGYDDARAQEEWEAMRGLPR
jgi:hypothetical protein